MAILTQCFIGLALPIYFFTVAIRSKQFPSRQNLTLILRAMTCIAVVWGTDYPTYQFLFLELIHILFIVGISMRFNRFQTARSLGLLWSYGMLPTLIFSLRFDQSGVAPVILSSLILISCTVVHVWSRDWVYRLHLHRLRKQRLKEFQALQAQKRHSKVSRMQAANVAGEKEASPDVGEDSMHSVESIGTEE